MPQILVQLFECSATQVEEFDYENIIGFDFT